MVIDHTNITLPYEDAVNQYPRFKTMHSNAIHELESKYGFPAFKHTANTQITLLFTDDSDGEPIGFCLWFFDHNERTFFIGLIYIDTMHRRKGHATNLMYLILGIAENLFSAKYVNSYIIDKNVGSMKLHRHIFGEPVGSIFIHKLSKF